MKKRWLWLYGLTVAGVLMMTIAADRSIQVMSSRIPVERKHCFVLDAGHGGIDGGAISCTGIRESGINLEICTRIRDVLHLLGYQTRMIRTGDYSVYVTGDTIAQQKISDLKERVRITNETDGALLVSIHQNYFPDSKYYGTQVFYANDQESRLLAGSLQRIIVNELNPESKRTEKSAKGIYLMERVNCSAVLIECGFLSNPEEEARLRDPEYQKQLGAVIGVSLVNWIDGA